MRLPHIATQWLSAAIFSPRGRTGLLSVLGLVAVVLAGSAGTKWD
jgi:hypothetical protein